jgi:hypothetical protein
MLNKIRNASELLAAFGGATLRGMLGEKALYEISAGYRHRSAASHFDDTEYADEWQREVYETAKGIAEAQGIRTIYDVGCGSAYKLISILGEYDTVGFDVQTTVDVARSRYPERKWLVPSSDGSDLPKADLVISADTIEHVLDPDAFMRFLINCAKRWLIISTPDRKSFYRQGKLNSGRLNKHFYGPPSNPSHFREWTMPELRRYVGRFAKVERHEISNRSQATQMIVASVFDNFDHSCPN